MLNLQELTWLKPQVESWRARVAQGRVPHALMLQGNSGLGKRSLAAWLARDFLGASGEAMPAYPEERPQHADLRWITPPEDKHTIGIDAIRDLVADLALTSYEGRGKVAVVEPANAMTVNAANSLLKTLEEPAGNTLLILVADRVERIPATIFSRCQRISFAAPALADSLAWLEHFRPGPDWNRVLRESGTAPLAALQAAEQSEQTEMMRRTFADLPEGRCSPLKTAAGWSKFEPVFLFGWLAMQVQNCILRSFLGAAGTATCLVSDTVLRGIDRRNLFCYLDSINRLRSQPVGSYNVLLTLESLLIDWAARLRDCREQGNT